MTANTTRVCARTEICSHMPSVVTNVWHDAGKSGTPKYVLSMAGEQLTSNDAEQVVSAYLQLSLVQFDILSHFPRSLQVGPNAYYRYIAKLLRYDVAEVFEQLSNFKDWLQHYTALQSHLSVRAAKASMLQHNVDLNHGTFDLIRPLVYKYVKEELLKLHTGACEPVIFRYLYDFSCLISRVTLKSVDSIIDAAVEKYCDQEREMKSWVYPQDVVNELREIVIARLEDLCLVDDISVYPDMHHSNGATSECRRGVGIEVKYNHMKIPKELWLYLKRCTGLDLRQWPGVSLCEHNELSSKIQFVPKGINKKRVISMEPTGLVFVQNALFRSFDNLFKAHPEYGIDLHDQEKSRKVVYEAAGKGGIATIDLSSASDSVTFTLVKQLLNGTIWWPLIESSRTLKGVLPDGRVIKYEKCYPMGTPLCFVTMCLVFSCICELACKRKDVNSFYRIYGDDIEVDSNIYSEVVDLLTQLHFTVNIDKSFGPYEFFKESCGAESFFGFDVSPCRISRRFDIVGVRSARFCYISPAIVGALEMSNRYAAYGYTAAAQLLAREVLRIIPFLAYTTEDSVFGFRRKSAKNSHLIKLHESGFKYKVSKTSRRRFTGRHTTVKDYDILRYNYHLQRFEVLIPQYTLKRNPQSTNIRYWETLRTNDRRSARFEEQPLNVYVGNTKEYKLKMAYFDDICVKIDKPLRNIPLCPPGYWESRASKDHTNTSTVAMTEALSTKVEN